MDINTKSAFLEVCRTLARANPEWVTEGVSAMLGEFNYQMVERANNARRDASHQAAAAARLYMAIPPKTTAKLQEAKFFARGKMLKSGSLGGTDFMKQLQAEEAADPKSKDRVDWG